MAGLSNRTKKAGLYRRARLQEEDNQGIGTDSLTVPNDTPIVGQGVGIRVVLKRTGGRT